MSTATSRLIPAPVKTEWSTIDMTKFGPLKEARMARLLRWAWSDPKFKKDFLAHPKEILEREASVILPAQTMVTAFEENSDAIVHFVVPVTPPKSELIYRLEQIADWWMLAHAFYFFMSTLEHGEQAGALLDGIQVAFLARIWTEPAFHSAIIADPKSVLERETGMSFPAVKAHQDTPEHVRMVLPLAPNDQKLDRGFETMGSWFMTAHTLWWFLNYPRLLAPAFPVVTDWVG